MGKLCIRRGQRLGDIKYKNIWVMIVFMAREDEGPGIDLRSVVRLREGDSAF